MREQVRILNATLCLTGNMSKYGQYETFVVRQYGYGQDAPKPMLKSELCFDNSNLGKSKTGCSSRIFGS